MEHWRIGSLGIGCLGKFAVSGEGKRMQGRVVIVTGAAKGIGRHAAHTLVKAGARVVLADTDVERMRKTFNELQALKAEALAVTTDVRDEKHVRRMVHEVVDHFGQIDG